MIEVTGPIETAAWLVVLEPGPLGGCLVCRTSTIWRHPERGPVHPQCVPAVVRASVDDGGGEPLAPTVSGERWMGAYSRRRGMVA